jgi:hypothetical protein
MTNSDLPEDIMTQARSLCTAIEKAVELEVVRRGMARFAFPVLMPCNLLCVLDSRLIHIAFTNINAGGVPSQTWRDKRRTVALTPKQVLQASIAELGFTNPSSMHFDASILKAPENVYDQAVRRMAKDHVEDIVKLATRPRAIDGYLGLQPLLDKFSEQNPNFDKNVFIAMRFRPGKQFSEIHESIKSSLMKYGLKGLRADDRVYPPDGDLWSNICIYMMGCKLGVCVFEEVDDREFNPNVPLEYGFMRAMNRQVLLLKDIRMPKMPSDMTGKLYRGFDTYNITMTINEQIGQWAERDLDLKPLV